MSTGRGIIKVWYKHIRKIRQQLRIIYWCEKILSLWCSVKKKGDNVHLIPFYFLFKINVSGRIQTTQLVSKNRKIIFKCTAFFSYKYGLFWYLENKLYCFTNHELQFLSGLPRPPKASETKVKYLITKNTFILMARVVETE